MKYINKYSKFQETNEGFKTWLSTFLLLANLGMVPLSVKASDSKSKKDFVESLPDSQIDAAKFLQFLNANNMPIEKAWDVFKEKDSSIKSSLNDVQKYLNKDGKTYRIGQKYKSQDFSNVDINTFQPENWLTDMGSFIPDSLEPNINNMISDYEKKTTIEIGIVTVKSLGDNVIEEYANKQFNRIGVGKKGANNGILIVFSMDDRKSRIETGRGMEEYLPDAYCNRILTQIVRPNFKEGKYYEGTIEAIKEIENLLGNDVYAHKVEWDRQMKKIQDARWEQSKEEFYNGLADTFLVILLLTLIGYLMYKKRKNDLTKKEILELTDKIKETQQLISDLNISEKSDFLEEVLKDVQEIGKNATELIDKTLKVKNIDDKKDKLADIDSKLQEAIKNFRYSREKVQSNIEAIKNIDNKTMEAYRIVDRAILAYEKIREYGYDSASPKQRTDVDSFSNLVTKAKSLLPTNVDEAMVSYNEYITAIGKITSSSSAKISNLATIQNAEKDVKNSKSLINKALNDMNRYQSYAQSGEKEKVESQVEKEQASLLSIKDILNAKSKLDSIIKIIEDMMNKWKKRKDDEEEAEREEARRKRRREEEEEESRRRSSYSSSSDSGGGFGGFGGGSSSGGGASSGW